MKVGMAVNFCVISSATTKKRLSTPPKCTVIHKAAALPQVIQNESLIEKQTVKCPRTPRLRQITDYANEN